MRLASVSISNFKSVKSLSFDFPDSNILVLVGPNNAGKTNIVRAIDLLCGESWASSDRLEDIDFYCGDRGQEIQIDLAFDDGCCATFRSKAKWPIALRTPDGEDVRSASSVLKALFPCTYMGADRTLDTHLSFYDWTLIGKIRKAFHRRSEPIQDRLREKYDEIISIFDEVEGFSEFKSDFADFFSEMQADTPAKLRIDFKPFTPSNYFKTMQVLASDPRQGNAPLDLKQLGEGTRNMALLALLRSYAKNFRTGDGVSGILVLEEPELFLHPQARRHLAAVLRDLAASGLQVIISTHSASFIETEFFDSIGQVYKAEDKGTGRHETRIKCVTKAALRDHCVSSGVPASKVTEQNLPLFYKATANSRLNEAFFARVVVLVEGETEELALPEYLSSAGLDCDLRGVSIIGVGGKNQIPKYWRLFSKFRPPVIVMFDNDDDGTGHKRKSNHNIAKCFGLAISDFVATVDAFKVLEAKRKPTTRLFVLEKDFESALRKDLASQEPTGAATFDRLDAAARELIKPVGNQNKGAIARQIARGLAEEIPSFTPAFVATLKQDIETKIGKKRA